MHDHFSKFSRFNDGYLRIISGLKFYALALTATRFCLPLFRCPSPSPSPLFSSRTSRRTPAPKGLVATAGLSAEAPISYRPR